MNPHTEHLKGRRSTDIPDRKWPVVTQSMMKRVELGEPTPQDNPVVHSLIAGKVHLHNALLNLRRARLSTENDLLKEVCDDAILQIQELLEHWPLEVVP